MYLRINTYSVQTETYYVYPCKFVKRLLLSEFMFGTGISEKNHGMMLTRNLVVVTYYSGFGF